MKYIFLQKTTFFSILFLLYCQIGVSQDMNSRKLQRVEEIQNSKQYFSGIGVGASLNEADQNALENLTNSISINIYTTVTAGVSSMTVKEKEVLKEDFQKYTKTGSFANLRNTRQIIVEEGDNELQNFKVLRYIDTTDLNEVYREREMIVRDYISFAQKKERDNEIGYALGDYYKALLLLKTSPNMNSMVHITGDGKQHKTITFLNNKMEELLQDIEVEVAGMNTTGKEITLCFKYKNKPIAGHVLYDYYDEVMFENFYNRQANNGYSKLGFNGKPAKIEITLTCHDESNVNDEMVKTAMEVLGKQNFRNAKKTIHVTTAPQAQAKSNPKTDSKIADANEQKIPEEVKNKLLNVMYELEAAINTKQYSSVQDYFTTEGKEMWNTLVKRGEATLLMQADYRFLQLDTTIYCRSMKMQFAFKDNFRPIVEDVCFRFNSDHKITSLSFTVNSSTEMEILDDGKQWSDTARIVLLSFLEDYKTAYALKRADYLEKIFSNDALIISGVVVKNKPLKDMDMPNLGRFSDHEVVYSVKSKDEFMTDLRRNFARKDWVNIMFEDVEVKRRLCEDADLYGIQVKQNYFSSNYCDEGYLSLLVDLKGELPVIYVRVWQEEKSKEFSAGIIVNKPGLMIQLGNN